MNLFHLGSHPLNLLFRFVLEILVLVTVAVWCWNAWEGWIGFVSAFAIPFALALIWGGFTVPDDPSRSGTAPIPISGSVRLLIELSIFSFALWCLYDLGRLRLCLIFGLMILGHYLFSLDRMRWLIKNPPPGEAGDH